MSDERARICLGCRTLLDGAESCNAKGHVSVSLTEKNERPLLEDEVWGPDSRARMLRQAAKAGAGSGFGGGLMQGCDLLDCGSGFDACNAGSAGEGLVAALMVVVVAIIAALLGALLFFLIRWIVRVLREKLRKPKPHGALFEPPRVARRAVTARGVVRAGGPIPLPWADASALGYAMELYEEKVFGGGAMLRDARVSDLEIALDDGRTLRIPKGRVRVLGKRQKAGSGAPAVDKDRTKEFLRSLDPRAPLIEGRDLFPFDHVRALTIEPGDRIEVLGDVEVAADGRAAAYRENAGILHPIGLPILRVHKRYTTTDEVRIRVEGDGQLPTEQLAEDSDERSAEGAAVPRQ